MLLGDWEQAESHALHVFPFTLESVEVPIQACLSLILCTCGVVGWEGLEPSATTSVAAYQRHQHVCVCVASLDGAVINKQVDCLRLEVEMGGWGTDGGVGAAKRGGLCWCLVSGAIFALVVAV